MSIGPEQLEPEQLELPLDEDEDENQLTFEIVFSLAIILFIQWWRL